MKKLSLLLLFLGACAPKEPPVTPTSAPTAVVKDEFVFDDRTSIIPSNVRFRNAMDVAAADFNKDGFLDIVLANEFQPNTLLLSNGQKGFTDASLVFTATPHDSEDIAIADFDNNGWLDIVFVSEDDFKHEMYLNQGQGNFTNVSSRLPNSEANAVAVADFNNDGFVDLLIGNNGQNTMLINNGKGEFKDETKERLPVIMEVTQDVKVADLDKDGDLDIVEGNEGTSRILINEGGKFRDETRTRWAITANIETRKVTFEDIDKDNDLDILLCNVGWNTAKLSRNFILLNDGKGNFTKNMIELPSSGVNCLEGIFTDVNDDGKPDIILGYLPNSKVVALIQKDNLTFEENNKLIPNTVGNWIGILAADFDNDKKTDLYFASRGTSDALFLKK